ncbi:MAG: hypothetical protein AAFR38_00360 [Planctomycetota bacterium]
MNTWTTLAIAGLAGLASAQTTDTTTPDAGLLSGPEVRENQTGESLASFGMTPMMRGPDMTPVAERALERLELDEPTRAEIDEILGERAAAIDAVVRDNLDLFTRRFDQRGLSKEEREAIQQQAAEALAPITENGPLVRQIAQALPEDQREPYIRAIAEHRDLIRQRREMRRMQQPAEGDAQRPQRNRAGARAGDRPEPMLFRDDPAAAPKRPERASNRQAQNRQAQNRQAQNRQAMRLMGQVARSDTQTELRRSLDRVLGTKVRGYELLVSELDLTQEQQAKLRELGEKGLLRPPPRMAGRNGDAARRGAREVRQRDRFNPEVREFFMSLSREQRQQMIKLLRDGALVSPE